MASYIHFIRHGITEGTQNKWFYGRVDMPLAEEGVATLRELKAEGIYPSDPEPDYYTSGMLRANQSLQVIFGDVKFRTIEELREMDFGEWECKTFEQLKELEGFEQWVNDKTGSFVFPGGESAEIFYDRCDRGLDRLVGLHRLKELSCRHNGKNAVSTVVCHGGAIAACMFSLFKEEKDSFWSWIPATGRGYTVYFRDGKAENYKEI